LEDTIENTYINVPKGLDDIPLPTEIEDATDITRDSRRPKKPSLLDTLKSKIKLEEIILLGLIFLLFEEGIDDEFLLILLIYILLA